MMNKKNRFKLSKLCLVALIVALICIFTFNKSNIFVIQNKQGIAYKASASDSSYTTMDDGFVCSMVTQQGPTCYAYKKQACTGY